MLPSCFRFRAFPLPFSFLSSASLPVPATQPSVLPFLSLPGSASQLLSRCALPLSLRGFPRSFRPDFSCLLSRFFVLGFLFVSFRPSLIRSHSCSSGAYLVLSLSVFPLSIRILSSASLPVLATQLSVSSFPFSFRFCLTAAFSVYHFLLSLLWFSPFFQNPVSRVFFSGSRTRLSVCFLSSFPVSLPQPFHRCLPFAFAFGIFPLRLLSFVRFRLGSDYSAFRSFFSLLPVFPCRRFLRCIFSSSVRPVAMPFFRFRYSAYCKFFSPVAVSPHSGLLQRLSFSADFPWLTL